MFIDALRGHFENLEVTTIGSAFGGPFLDTRAPTFNFFPIVDWSIDNLLEHPQNSFPRSVVEDLRVIRASLSMQEFRYLMRALYRFSFCIELTNLGITSTKMKTRWMPVVITKTRPGTYENYAGSFAPGDDERSSSFNECLSILFKCISLLSASPEHLNIIKSLSRRDKRIFAYEAVFTYINPNQDPVHLGTNIRLVESADILWLIKARPLIYPAISQNSEGIDSKLIGKIATKAYKTDRSQTGEVQTNRAKRWECLSQDFQHATIEECWSVERKLLSDIAHFVGFPEVNRDILIREGLFGLQEIARCPITFRPMILRDILNSGAHGISDFQVGHLNPLKAGGRHTGENIEWISGDGNRIQGSLSIEETRNMLIGIFMGMAQNGLLPAPLQDAHQALDI